MYRFIDYKKIFEQEGTSPMGEPAAPQNAAPAQVQPEKEEEKEEDESKKSEDTDAGTGTESASQAEIAAQTGYSIPTAGANPVESKKAIMSFDNFVSEAKKEKWIGDLNMKKGALRKEMHKGKGEKISAADLAKSEAKLKKKDKDKKKPGLQLSKKDAKTHKRNVLAKNLMKASGAMHESKQMKIKGAKDQLVKLHEVIEKMMKKTSKKSTK